MLNYSPILQISQYQNYIIMENPLALKRILWNDNMNITS